MNATRFMMFAIFALFSMFASSQQVQLIGVKDGAVTLRLSTSGILAQTIPGFGVYTPPANCSGTVRLSRTPDGGVELVESGFNEPGFNGPTCLAKGLEGRGWEMPPKMILFDLETEMVATRGPDGLFRAILPPSVRPTSTEVYITLVPTSTKEFDFRGVPWVDFGFPKSLLRTVPVPESATSNRTYK